MSERIKSVITRVLGEGQRHVFAGDAVYVTSVTIMRPLVTGLYDDEGRVPYSYLVMPELPPSVWYVGFNDLQIDPGARAGDTVVIEMEVPS